MLYLSAYESSCNWVPASTLDLLVSSQNQVWVRKLSKIRKIFISTNRSLCHKAVQVGSSQSQKSISIVSTKFLLETFKKATYAAMRHRRSITRDHSIRYILNSPSGTHFAKTCSRLGYSRFVFCKKILEKVRKKSRNHDLQKCVPEGVFEIFRSNIRTLNRLSPPLEQTAHSKSAAELLVSNTNY